MSDKQKVPTIKSVSLNIAILPSDEAVVRAITMSKQIAESLGSEFVLGLDTLIPHVSIYQGEYPERNIDSLKSIVSDLAKEQESFEIKLNSISVSHGTFLFWNCDKTDILRNLHQEAVKLANPLREGLVLTQLADRTELSPGDKYDVENFGSLLIGPRFTPHITITRLKKEEDAGEAISLLGVKEFSFKPKGLVLGYLGKDGTVIVVLEIYNFKQVSHN